MTSLNLSSLGVELDSVRRARQRRASDAGAQPDAVPPAAPAIETDDDEEASTASEVPESPFTSPETRTRALPVSSTKRVAEPEPQPLPLCLLCFTRPPSAVLLPCAHLNLCYLCAPLLMHKKAKAECFRDAAAPAAGQADTPNPRAGYAAALSRAVGSSPKARRLSMGGYVAPREGVRGGEMRGRDLLAAADSGAGGGASGIAASTDVDGQVRLRLEGCGAGAQCLVCRADVSGWLRIYTG